MKHLNRFGFDGVGGLRQRISGLNNLSTVCGPGSHTNYYGVRAARWPCVSVGKSSRKKAGSSRQCLPKMAGPHIVLFRPYALAVLAPLSVARLTRGEVGIKNMIPCAQNDDDHIPDHLSY